MTRKEAFEKIKKLFGEDKKFENAKLKDGTLIQWEGELIEGVALMVVDTDGNMTPAPDSDVELEDGTKITVVGGLVTKIEKPVDAAEQPASEFEKAVIALTEKFAALTEKFTAVEAKITAYDEKFTAIDAVVKSTKTDTSEKFEAIKKLVEEIADEPAAEAVRKPGMFAKKKVEGAPTAAERIMAVIKDKKANS